MGLPLTDRAGLGRGKPQQNQHQKQARVGTGLQLMAFLWLCVSLGNAVSCSSVSESSGLHVITGCLLCRLSLSPPFALCRVLCVERSKEATSAIKSLALTVMPLGEEVALNTIMLLYRNQTFTSIEIKLA